MGARFYLYRSRLGNSTLGWHYARIVSKFGGASRMRPFAARKFKLGAALGEERLQVWWREPYAPVRGPEIQTWRRRGASRLRRKAAARPAPGDAASRASRSGERRRAAAREREMAR